MPRRRPARASGRWRPSAGVSPTTVSHALSGTRAVGAETRERVIRAAAQDSANVRTASTSGLRLQRTGVVGLVSDRIATTPVAGRIVQGAQDAARERGVVLMVVDTEGEAELEAQQLRALLDHRVDGILLARMSHQVGSGRRRSARHRRSPWSTECRPTVGGCRPSPPTSVESRRRRSRIWSPPATGGSRWPPSTGDAPATRGRETGFHEGARRGRTRLATGLERGTSDAHGGRAAGRRLLDRPPAERPTAVFCFNDQMAMGVYQAASAIGLHRAGRLLGRRCRRPRDRGRRPRAGAHDDLPAASRDGSMGDDDAPRSHRRGRRDGCPAAAPPRVRAGRARLRGAAALSGSSRADRTIFGARMLPRAPKPVRSRTSTRPDRAGPRSARRPFVQPVDGGDASGAIRSEAQRGDATRPIRPRGRSRPVRRTPRSRARIHRRSRRPRPTTRPRSTSRVTTPSRSGAGAVRTAR